MSENTTHSTEKTFFFRKRTNNNSAYDPYDSLSVHQTRNSSHSDNHHIFEEDISVWTNDTTAILSKPPSPMPSPKHEPVAIPIVNIDSSAGVQKASFGSKESERAPSSLVNKENEVRNSILAGSVAGMTSCILFHPFDVIRTKIQVATKLSATTSTNTSASSASRAAGATLLSTSAPSATRTRISSSSGPIAVFSHTIKNGGMKAFYTGMALPLAAQAAYKATVFTTNRVTSNMLVDFKTKEQWKTGIFKPYEKTFSDTFLCGAISGAVNALVFVSPVEYARNQLIAQHTRIADGKMSKASMMRGPFDVLSSTLKKEGIFGCWRGAGVTLVRDSVGCGVFFVMFELGKKHLPSITGSEQGSRLNTVGAGLMAGFGYWFASLPLDSLKTLVQSGKANSAINTVSTLVKRDGVIGGISQLYRGWQLAFGRGSPSAAVTLTTYSAVYNFCDKNLG